MATEDDLWAHAGPAFQRRNAGKLGRPAPAASTTPTGPGQPAVDDRTVWVPKRERARAEALWAAQVSALALRLGWRRYHTHDSRRSEPGFPDEVLVRSHRIIFAELKTDAAQSKLTAAQVEWLDAIAACGLEVYVWRPQHLDEVELILTRDDLAPFTCATWWPR